MRDSAKTYAAIRGLSFALPVAAFLAAPAQAATKPAEAARYLWNLATETGPIRTSAAALTFDPTGREIVVTSGDAVRIFQQSGMEDFAFPVTGRLDRVLGAAVLDEGGDLVLLGMSGQRVVLLRTSFRGETVGAITPSGAPDGFLDGFIPTAVRVHDGRIYLADLGALRVLVVRPDGSAERAVDLAKLLLADVPENKRGDVHLSGFGVDVDGGLLFTVAVLFKAFVLPPGGELREWGRAGGAPGMFNVVSGIAADERHYYVVDQLKCAVIAFDRAGLGFVDEFGYRRVQSAGGLVGPTHVAAGNGQVFVSQYADRGVAVFAAPAGRDDVAVSAAAPSPAGEAAPQ
jgi:hypothetical protein